MALLKANRRDDLFSPGCVLVNGPIIVGAGPAGLAAAASFRKQRVPFMVLEREDCIAPLWQKHTYNRLKLTANKDFCKLPGMAFPADYPEYPSRLQFIDYLDAYAKRFEIKPKFNTTVLAAHYDEIWGLWRVRVATGAGAPEVEYISRWLVVATGENAESVVPDIPGLDSFAGEVAHVSEYKSGEAYRGKRVLVVGCGNSGVEVSLDLFEHGARPAMVVRDAAKLDIFHRVAFSSDPPPYQLNDTYVDALKHIRDGDIYLVPTVNCFAKNHVELVNGRKLDLDAVVLATGYRSNVREWLQGGDDLFDDKGYPGGWKGGKGLYAVGFTGQGGLDEISRFAVDVAKDLGKVWKEEMRPLPTNRIGARRHLWPQHLVGLLRDHHPQFLLHSVA